MGAGSTIGMVLIYDLVDEVKALFRKGLTAKANKLMTDITAKASQIGADAVAYVNNELGQYKGNKGSERLNAANKVANAARKDRQKQINSLSSDIDRLNQSAANYSNQIVGDTTLFGKQRKQAQKQLEGINTAMDVKTTELAKLIEKPLTATLSNN